MKTWQKKALAILDVFLLAFVIVPFLTLGIYQLFPRFEAWQTESLGFPFPVFTYVVMIGVVLLVLLARRKRFAQYGLIFTYPKYHLDIAGICFIPVVLANMPFGLGIDHKSWSGAFVLAGVQIILLFTLGWLLRKKPSVATAAAGIIWVPALVGAADPVLGKVLVVFITYSFFVGFGEEVLYRGYIQSRLDEAFDRPYQFFGVSFGWGAVITALLFGFSHMGVLRWALGLSPEVTIAWGFWTVFSGLIFSFVRLRSGSILAPALLHGLPQAIASAVLLFFQ